MVPILSAIGVQKKKNWWTWLVREEVRCDVSVEGWGVVFTFTSFEERRYFSRKESLWELVGKVRNELSVYNRKQKSRGIPVGESLGSKVNFVLIMEG